MNELPREIDIPMTFVPKGWGHELIICNGPEYCGKKLHMNAGKHLSWHRHELKDEVFFCATGKVKVVYGNTDDMDKARERILNPGDNFHVYRGLRHRLYALEDSDIYEFSTQHFDSDSIRIIPGD